MSQVSEYFEQQESMSHDEKLKYWEDYFNTESKAYTCRFCGKISILRKGYSTTCFGCAEKGEKVNLEWL